MFLTATLSLNPSTQTEYVASDNEDEKSELLEHETFSTSSLLQRLVLTIRGQSHNSYPTEDRPCS